MWKILFYDSETNTSKLKLWQEKQLSQKREKKGRDTELDLESSRLNILNIKP